MNLFYGCFGPHNTRDNSISAIIVKDVEIETEDDDKEFYFVDEDILLIINWEFNEIQKNTDNKGDKINVYCENEDTLKRVRSIEQAYRKILISIFNEGT